MRNIFIGLLFVFLDFNLNLGSSTIGLIPDFIGYILIYQGLGEISLLSGWFAKVRPWALGMIIYTAFLYALDLFGLWSGTSMSYVGILLGLASIGVSLYISYGIVMGVKDIEASEGRRLDGERLFQIWKVMAILSAASYLLLIIPALAMVSIIASLIVGIVFLVAFSRTKNLYYG